MSDSKTRIVKQAFIEGRLRGAGILENKEVLEELRQKTGYNWQRPDKEYKDEQVDLIAGFLVERDMKHGKSLNEAIFQLGCNDSIGFVDTILGRVSFGAAHLLTPAKLIERVLKTFEIQTNYGERSFKQINPTYIQIVMKDEPAHPLWLKGLFTNTFNYTGIKDFKVECKSVGVEQVVIDITW